MKNLYFLVFILSFPFVKSQNFYIDVNSFRDHLKSNNLKSKPQLIIPVKDNSVEIFSITENDLIRNRVDNVFTFDGVSKSGAILKLTSINDKLYGLILKNGELWPYFFFHSSNTSFSLLSNSSN